MIETVRPGFRRGCIAVPPSKSVAHRKLISAALSGHESRIRCGEISKDIRATINCLSALGTVFSEQKQGIIKVTPSVPGEGSVKHMYCGESGSTLRFLLPVVSALGIPCVFHPEGRLSQRPLTELTSQLEKNGAVIGKKENLITCSGKLAGGSYTVPGNISSQFISGLLFALPLLDKDSRLDVTGRTESAPYITLTEHALSEAGIVFNKDDGGYSIPGGQHYDIPENCTVEGDWSNAAFFLCMGALSPEGIRVTGLDPESAQGDKKILQLLEAFGAEVSVSENSVSVKRKEMRPLTIDASEIPDLVPVLSVLMLGADGVSTIRNAQRLRMKESDRLCTTAELITSLGGTASETEDGLIITGNGSLSGGIADAHNDHRIAMAAAVAASICRKDAVVRNAECTDKSYPLFWEDLNSLEVL